MLLALALLLPAAPAVAKDTAPADEFSRLVRMEPFIVKGKQLSISIHARSSGDRRYALNFAEEVIRVVCEAGVTQETGKGLVIIGRKGEPHPIHVFRKFLALAEAGKLDPAVAARGPELSALIDHWRKDTDRDRDTEDLEFEKIVTALPLPLQGVGAKIYQLAWAEKFDDAKVEARLRTLTLPDLERRDLFARFDWAFYLPPKTAFDKVLDDLIAEALKEEDPGLAARMAIKGAMIVLKPKIRQAIEAVRRGLLLQNVVQARTKLTEDEVDRLMDAYIEELMPFQERKRKGSEHERAVQAVREALEKLQDKSAAVAADDKSDS
jgi:hypothetical protein